MTSAGTGVLDSAAAQTVGPYADGTSRWQTAGVLAPATPAGPSSNAAAATEIVKTRTIIPRNCPAK
jgi:hypothetical protein